MSNFSYLDFRLVEPDCYSAETLARTIDLLHHEGFIAYDGDLLAVETSSGSVTLALESTSAVAAHLLELENNNRYVALRFEFNEHEPVTVQTGLTRLSSEMVELSVRCSSYGVGSEIYSAYVARYDLSEDAEVTQDTAMFRFSGDKFDAVDAVAFWQQLSGKSICQQFVGVLKAGFRCDIEFVIS